MKKLSRVENNIDEEMETSEVIKDLHRKYNSVWLNSKAL